MRRPRARPRLFGANFLLDVDGKRRDRPRRAALRRDLQSTSESDLETGLQQFGGNALSPRAPETLARLLDHYLVAHEDRTLRTIADQLAAAEFVAARRRLHEPAADAAPASSSTSPSRPDSDYAELTETLAPVIGGQNAVGPSSAATTSLPRRLDETVAAARRRLRPSARSS